MVEKYLTQRNVQFYPLDEALPLEGIVRPGWLEVVVVKRQRGQDRISRLDYELCVLSMLREKLRLTEIWVEGANKYGNPDQVLPDDFQQNRENYYALLKQPLSAEAFTDQLKARLEEALIQFNATVGDNPAVKILSRGKGLDRVSPLPAQCIPFPVGLKSRSQSHLADDEFARRAERSGLASSFHR